ncbi:unnamed protein product, partial [Amoebophrya sp. A120]
FVPPTLLQTSSAPYPEWTWAVCGGGDESKCHHSLPLTRPEGDNTATDIVSYTGWCYHWFAYWWAVEFQDKKPRHITGFSVFRRNNIYDGNQIQNALIYLNDSPSPEPAKTPSIVRYDGTFVQLDKQVWKIKLEATGLNFCGFWLYESTHHATSSGTFVEPARLSVTASSVYNNQATYAATNPLNR